MIGGPQEQALGRDHQARGAEPWCAWDRTHQPRPDLASLGAKATLMVGNDTGPTYLAAFAGAPSVVLFSSDSDPALCAPRGVARRRCCKANDLGELPAVRSDRDACRPQCFSGQLDPAPSRLVIYHVSACARPVARTGRTRRCVKIAPEIIPIRRPMPAAPSKDGPRINDEIRTAKVLLIDQNGEKQGVMPIGAALEAAEEVGLLIRSKSLPTRTRRSARFSTTASSSSRSRRRRTRLVSGRRSSRSRKSNCGPTSTSTTTT